MKVWTIYVFLTFTLKREKYLQTESVTVKGYLHQATDCVKHFHRGHLRETFKASGTNMEQQQSVVDDGGRLQGPNLIISISISPEPRLASVAPGVKVHLRIWHIWKAMLSEYKSRRPHTLVINPQPMVGVCEVWVWQAGWSVQSGWGGWFGWNTLDQTTLSLCSVCIVALKAKTTCSFSCVGTALHDPVRALLHPVCRCSWIYYFPNPEGRRNVSSIIIFLQNVTDFTAHPNLLAVIIGHDPLL